MIHCYSFYMPIYSFGMNDCGPSQAKELTEGGHLHKMQVDVPWSVEPYLHLITLQGSVTDTLYYNFIFSLC